VNRAGVSVNRTAANVNAAGLKVNAAGRIVFPADNIANRTGRNVIRSARIVFNHRASMFSQTNHHKAQPAQKYPHCEIIIQNIAPFDL